MTGYHLCQKSIPLSVNDKNQIMSNTYCMRPRGHEGKCAEAPTEEDKKEKP